MNLAEESLQKTLTLLNFRLTPDLRVLNDAEIDAQQEGLSPVMVRFLQQRKLSHALDAGEAEDPQIRASFRGRMREIDELLGLLKRE